MLQLSSILTRKTPRKAENKIKSLQNFNIRKKEEKEYSANFIIRVLEIQTQQCKAV